MLYEETNLTILRNLKAQNFIELTLKINRERRTLTEKTLYLVFPQINN